VSRSTWALFVLLAVLGVGAIVVATRLRAKLVSPAGQRLAAENRLRTALAGVQAYRAEFHAWPERLLQPIRSGHLAFGASAGVLYRRPAEDAPADTVVLWRELLLPAVRRGDPWSGPADPAPSDVPAVGLAATVGGQVLRLPPDEFARRTGGAGAAAP
jgi:hypothetical protein